MRPTLRHTAAVGILALVTVLGGCSDAAAPEDGASTGPTEQTQEPAPTAEPTTEAPVGTTLPPEVMLTGADFGMDREDAVVTEPIGTWALPDACTGGVPSTAAASRGVAYGNGELESTVGTHQVAVFADVAEATAEAQRLGDVMTACAAAPAQDGGALFVEDVPVGAQGKGLAVDYYGTSAGTDGQESLGYFVAITRRGNAVTLSGHLGGESSVGESRTNALSTSQAAWELLCIYDSAGC
ncbi:hypothetical protein [Sanguibacter sp. 25GB23B1]|uniref:hypothetical protein n=1 Tax=unclassified Sanguibacter TaxID=2645534 RepID=UPI0032AF685C